MTHKYSKYIGRHSLDLVELIQGKVESNSVPTIDPELVRSELSGIVSTEDVITFLEVLVEDGALSAELSYYCASEQCVSENTPRILTREELEKKTCSICDQAFSDAGKPGEARHYLTETPATRDIRWMIVIHGFNTRGPWQEKLSWLISNKLAYAAPVLIYKYGFERLGIFFRSRHNTLVRRLGAELSSAFEHSQSIGRSEPPDVIIHSFGSLLFSKFLMSEEYSEFKFGRVLCVGSIISPEYDWKTLMASGRVETVLCHCGEKDLPVRIAQYGIPDSGPAGYLGFNDKAVKNIRSDDFYHSTALQENLDSLLLNGGIWDRFFTDPSGQFSDDLLIKNPSWKPHHKAVQWLTRTIILLLMTILAIGIWTGISWIYVRLLFG